MIVVVGSKRRLLAFVASCCVTWTLCGHTVHATEPDRTEPDRTEPDRTESASTEPAARKSVDVNTIIRNAFAATHDGWSSDEVLLQDELNREFLKACRKFDPLLKTQELNWRLLNLRKAGKLPANVTRRRRDDHSSYRHLAEIVARTLQDRHRVSTDRVMCDAAWRSEFDHEATQIAPTVKPYLMRKAAFGLRKARQLKPELVLRIADWDRTVTSFPAEEILKQPTIIPEQPGIYIFRDSSGYLYVGEAANLRRRLATHLDESDRKSLASYLESKGISGISIELHAFPGDSRARKVSVRRAYESELIASRKPRFNVRP